MTIGEATANASPAMLDARDRVRHAMGDGRFAAVTGLLIVVALGVMAMPILLGEQTKDWTVYERAAARLAAGQPLYLFQFSAAREAFYLYPPLGAALWSVAGSAAGLLAVKVAALVGVATLAWLAVPRDAGRRDVLLVGCALAVVALIAPPDVHDLVLGNTMSLYVGAIAISLARRGWLGSLLLGLVIAAALKPFVATYLLWLVLRRPADLVRVAAVAVVASVVTALFIGPGRYVEYLQALPGMGTMTGLTSGNVGLSAISTAAVFIGVAFALVATVLAARHVGTGRSAAISIAAGLLVQPTIGFNYAGILIPAAVMLWVEDRPAGFIAFIAVPLAAIVSPLVAALLLIALAGSRLGDRWTSRPGASVVVAA
jgi:hypothetical protein